jgi:hypothetical protein
MKTRLKLLAICLVLAFLLVTPFLVLAQSGVSTITGDQTIVNGNFSLQAGETLNGNLSVVNGTTVLGAGSTVNGNVSIIQGKVTAAGLVTGDLSCINCSGNVADTAEIRGSLVSVGKDLTVSSKAKIQQNSSINLPFNLNLGNVNLNNLIQQIHQNQTPPTLVSKILMTIFVVLAMSALSVLIALLFPKGTRNVAGAIESQPLAAWGVGFLTVLVVEIAAVIMLFTLVLIPVSFVAQLGLVAAIVYGYVALGYEIGFRLSVNSNLNWTEPIAAGVGTLLLGLIVGIVSWIPILGILILIITPFFGLGAVVLSVFGSKPFPAAKSTQPIMQAIPTVPQKPVPPQMPEPLPIPATSNKRVASKPKSK